MVRTAAAPRQLTRLSAIDASVAGSSTSSHSAHTVGASNALPPPTLLPSSGASLLVGDAEPFEEDFDADVDNIIEELMDFFKERNGRDPTSEEVQLWLNTIREAAPVPPAPADETKKFPCSHYPSCDYRAKSKGALRSHLSFIHDVLAKVFPCLQPDCGYKAKKASQLTTHLSDAHDIGVKWHCCSAAGCSFRAKQSATLKRHLLYVHDVGVKELLACPVSDCSYKGKQKKDVRQHFKNIHEEKLDISTLAADVAERVKAAITPRKKAKPSAPKNKRAAITMEAPSSSSSGATMSEARKTVAV